jgi:rhamnosyltransferase
MSRKDSLFRRVGEQPSVAVLVAAFNGLKFFPEQLRSILDQKGISVTIYVSVDKSTDGTEDWIESIANANANAKSKVIVLPHGRIFGGAAKNFFHLLKEVDFSDFDYVSLADQDDVWLPNKLLRAHNVLSETGANGYSSNVIAFWTDGRRALINKSQPSVRWDFLFEAAGPGCTYVIEKELACAIQALVRSRWDEVQEVGLHDWFSYAFARANDYRWVIDAVPGMLYRQHESNQVGVNSGLRAFILRADKILNGWGLAQSALIARLVGMGDDPFVARWSGGSRLGLLYLALHAAQCRRRLRDKFIFGLSCLALILTRRSRR